MSFNHVLDKVKHELSVFTSFQAVVNKSENDGSLELIISMLVAIVRSEIEFTIKGGLRRTRKIQKTPEIAQRKKTYRK